MPRWLIALEVVLIAFIYGTWHRDQANRRGLLREETETLSQTLVRRLDSMRRVSETTAERLSSEPISEEALDAALEAHRRAFPEVTQFLIVDGSNRVVYSLGTPFETSSSLNREDAVRAAARARRGERTVFSDPFAILPEGAGFLIWTSTSDRDSGPGLFGTVVSCDALLASLGHPDLLQRYRLEFLDRSGVALSVRGQTLDGWPSYGVALEEPKITLRMTALESGMDTLDLILIIAVASLMVILTWMLWVSQRDALERQQVERALFESDRRYRMLVDHIDVGIALVDRDHCVLESNAAMGDLFGSSPKSFVGRQFLEDQSLFDTVGDKPIEVEQQIKRSDGTTFTALIKAFPLIDEESDELEGYIEMIIDISERKRAEEERLELERRIRSTQKQESLGVMAGGIAHDFNNLLMGILGNADLALLHGKTTPFLEGSLEDIRLAAKRAAELCKQMLAFSGKGSYAIEPLSLTSLIEEMAHLLQITAVGQIRTEYDLQKDLPLIDADPGQIRQVILNLVTNAVEAIGSEAGVVTLRTGVCHCDRAYLTEPYLDPGLAEGDYVYFEVDDEGGGMVPQVLDKVFDPFFTTKFTGRGLGLATVLGIVRGHGGAIKVSSEAGKGACFRVLLPESDTVIEKEIQVDVRSWRGKGSVLLVDDDQMVRTLCQHMLEYLGFEVMIATGGKRAVELFREHAEEITIVILDLAMPDMDGEATFRALREIRYDIKVLMASGFSEQEVSERFKGLGLSGFIHKPFQIEGLATKLSRVLED